MDHTQKYEKSGKAVSLLIGIAALLALAAFLIFSDTASEMVRKAILLCGQTLIPAIFPFLVLNGILFRLGFAEKLSRILGKPFSTLFGVNGSCAAAMISGILCGFPSGAASAYSIRKQGLCHDRDCERSLLISSFAAPGFLIAGVGASMLGSARRGLLLWLFQLSATLAAGLLWNFIKKTPAASEEYYVPSKNPGAFSCIASSIRDAANSMIGICGSVIFFSVLAGYIASLSFLPNTAICLMASFFELTSGASLTASLLLPDQAFVVIAAAVGWSGISVHAQTAMVTNGEIPLGKYLSGKILVALLTTLFAAIAVKSGLI